MKQAAFLGAEGPMRDMRRPDAVGERAEPLAALGAFVADPHVAFDHEDLFPVVMLEGDGGVGARLEFQKPGPAALAVFHVEMAGQDFLLDP